MAELIGKCTIGWNADEDDQLYRFRQQFKAANSGDTVGEVLRWQRADGYAQYMVVCEAPLQLAHLDMGDAWTVEPALIRGLNLEDVRQMVDSERALSEMFAKHKG